MIDDPANDSPYFARGGGTKGRLSRSESMDVLKDLESIFIDYLHRSETPKFTEANTVTFTPDKLQFQMTRQYGFDSIHARGFSPTNS